MKKFYSSAGERSFSKEKIETYERRYDEILRDGREQNQKTKGQVAREEEKKLLRRLEKYKESHLLFLHDFTVPFEKNSAKGI